MDKADDDGLYWFGAYLEKVPLPDVTGGVFRRREPSEKVIIR